MALAGTFNSFLKDLLAGGIASAVAETVTAPLERIKLLLQVQSTSRQISKEDRFNGLFDALRRIPQEQGILSLWRGNTISIIRGFPIKAFNLAFKDKLEYFMLRDVDPHKEPWKYAGGTFAAGGMAGGLALTLLFPLDLGRMRLATDIGAESKKGKKTTANGKKLKERQFKGYIDFIRKTTATNGILGLYEGYYISLLGSSLYRAIKFCLYDTSKAVYFDEPYHHAPLYQKWTVAQIAVVAAGLITYPIDSIRRRMMMQAGEKVEDKKYKNARDCFIKSVNEEGIRGLYKGALTNVIRSCGGTLVLVLYDEIKELPMFKEE